MAQKKNTATATPATATPATEPEQKVTKTNPVGKGTKTIGINVKQEMAEELERRAKSMQISTGAYVKIILGEWLTSGKKLNLQES